MAGQTAGVLKLFSLAVGVGAPAASFFGGWSILLQAVRGTSRPVSPSPSADNSPLGALNKMDQMRHLRRVSGVARLERADRSGEVAVLFEEQFLVSGLERADVVIGDPRRCNPMMLTPRVEAGLPSTIMKGGTSCTTFERPPTIECLPIRQN